MRKKISQLVFSTGLLLAANWETALAGNNLAILLPDVDPTAIPTDAASLPLAQAWLDAVNEEGFTIDIIRDSQFANLAANYKGIILPDSVHQKASTNLNTAINDYVVNQGGKVMIVYDFGALNSNGFFPACGPNPFSSLVGVDYNLYGELYGQTITPVGLGPIYGMESVLWNLKVPPGKYMAWPTTSSTTTTPSSANTAVSTASTPSSIPTAYLPTHTASVGGMTGYNHSYIHQIPHGTGEMTTTQHILAG